MEQWEADLLFSEMRRRGEEGTGLFAAEALTYPLSAGVDSGVEKAVIYQPREPIEKLLMEWQARGFEACELRFRVSRNTWLWAALLFVIAVAAAGAIWGRRRGMRNASGPLRRWAFGAQLAVAVCAMWAGGLFDPISFYLPYRLVAYATLALLLLECAVLGKRDAREPSEPTAV